MIELPLLESLDVQTEIEFNNVILQDGAGEVCSIIQWQDALRTFNLSREILYPPQRQELVDFFLSVKASGDTFLYKDKSDFKCRSLATPYGSSTYGALYPITGNDYQICKAYSIGDTTYLRPISHPVNVIVYNGGIVQTGWTLGDNGRITIPTAFDGIEFDFFVPVRFEEENLSSVITASYKDNSRILYSLSKLVLKEKKILFDINPVDTFTPFSTHVLTLDLLKGQYIERVQERVTEQSSGFEVIERQENESIIELQQRKILRKPEMDYLIAIWLCVKGDGGAFGFLRFDSSTITARFITKALSYQFEAYFGDNEAVFNLGGLAIGELRSQPKLDSTTYVITLVDVSGSMDSAIPNITNALADLKNILRDTVYGSQELADKYVKPAINFGDQRYLSRLAQDYIDNINEPKKYLFLVFENENSITVDSIPNYEYLGGYHYVPRVISGEPVAQYLTDFATFQSAYNSLALFNCLIFVPTSSPPIDYEVAFNGHIADAVNGNNGYSSLANYQITGKTNWPIDATGDDIYNAIIQYLI